MKKVTAIPEMEYAARRDPWLDDLFDGGLWELSPTDWSKRYATVRSASSAVKQAATHRSIDATVAIRGDVLYVQAKSNGQGPATKPVKKAPAKKATAKAVEAVKARATRQKAAAKPCPRKAAAAPPAA